MSPSTVLLGGSAYLVFALSINPVIDVMGPKQTARLARYPATAA